MKIISKVKNWILSSNGPFTASGRFVDYKEAHAFQYNVIKGFSIQRPSKLLDRLNAPGMDFEQWEDSEGHYKDQALILGYATSKTLFGGLTWVITHLTGVI